MKIYIRLFVLYSLSKNFPVPWLLIYYLFGNKEYRSYFVNTLPKEHIVI